jgi:hypothetical protein
MGHARVEHQEITLCPEMSQYRSSFSAGMLCSNALRDGPRRTYIQRGSTLSLESAALHSVVTPEQHPLNSA